MKTAKVKDCCSQMKKELFKMNLIKLHLSGEVNGVIKDEVKPIVELIRVVDIASNPEILYCPFCGQQIEIIEEALKKKF